MPSGIFELLVASEEKSRECQNLVPIQQVDIKQFKKKCGNLLVALDVIM